MLAPIDKISRGGNDIIQVLVTTACDLYSCSNCTQLLPFRKDYWHMSIDVFREAVRSLKDWPGIVGIFGGNPCSHPRFPELMAILVEEIPDQRHRGLWSNNLLKHGALCREVFYPHGRFNLNAHGEPAAAAQMDAWLPGRIIATSRNTQAMHGPILLDYRNFGFDDETWIAAREACDINTKWSAAIMERDGSAYAYFCEVAGALDGVRRENNGVPVKPGWWRWKMDRFEHQVRQCCDRGCGVPLRQVGHTDRSDTYDMSRSWLGLSQRPKNVVRVEEQTALTDQSKELTDYLRLRVSR